MGVCAGGWGGGVGGGRGAREGQGRGEVVVVVVVEAGGGVVGHLEGGEEVGSGKVGVGLVSCWGDASGGRSFTREIGGWEVPLHEGSFIHWKELQLFDGQLCWLYHTSRHRP